MPEGGQSGTFAAKGGKEKVDRAAEMGRDAHQPRPLGQPLEHEREVSILEVADPAVNQLRGAAGGLAGEVAGLDERDVQAP